MFLLFNGISILTDISPLLDQYLIKSWYLFCKVENMRICWQVNYNLEKYFQPLIIFAAILNCRCLTVFWIYYGSEYPTWYEIATVLNMPEFYCAYEHASGSQYARVQYMPLVLNIPGFWKWQVYKRFSIFLNHSWMFLIIPGYPWISLSMPEYTGLWVNK